MPVMDGYEFRDEQKKDPVLAAIPVVVITAGSAPAPSDFRVVLQKPLDVERLLAAVRRHLH